MRKICRLFIAILGAALCGTGAIAADVVPLNHLPGIAGDYFSVRSKEAEHDYHIYVRLPQEYAKDPSRRYPVVYLLDGDSLFPVVGGNHIFLTIDDKVPEAIVVGIAYGSFEKPVNRRHIDFMPPGPGLKPEEARVADFHNFLERELIPAVEGKYRADASKRILFGQSRGGALVLYSAFRHPDLFWARIASNPSWTPGEDIFYGAPVSAARKDLHLFIALGSGEYPDRRQAADKWFAHWNGRTTPWKLERLTLQGGTHSADSMNAYRAALRSLFDIRPSP